MNTDNFSFLNKPYFNASEAAAYLNIKKASLYNLVWKQKLKPHKLGTSTRSRLRFTKAELDKFMGVESVN